VPEEAVLTLAGVASVYLIENGIVRQQTIRLGEKEGKYFEVLEGLKGDEILAASNLNELVTGIRVGGGGGEEEAGPPGPTTSGDTVAPGAGERQGGREGAGRGRRGGGEGKGSAQ
jgi:hypothetical protein